MDIDLLTHIIKKYDPITRIVRNISGGPLIEITANEVRKVFQLSESSNHLEPIDFEMLKKVYNAQKDHLRCGPMRELFAKIGGLTLVGPSKVKPFPMNFFTLRAKGVYQSLCQFFGEDGENAMPTHYMLMMAQILNPSIAVAYEFAPYLANVIHEGLIGSNNAKVDRPFGQYSMLMHMFLFKGAKYFAKDMDLLRVKDGEGMSVQLWSAYLSWDREDASYLKFDRCFAPKL